MWGRLYFAPRGEKCKYLLRVVHNMAMRHSDKREAETLSTKIIRELPEGIAPLYDSVDPDALDELFADRASQGIVVFEHAGHQITARSSGEVSVE